MASVFISYSNKDKAFARELDSDLRHHGIQTWFDERNLNVGDTLLEAIPESITNADYVIVVLSRNSIHSGWVKKELSTALTNQLSRMKSRVLPVLLEKCEIPDSLIDKVYADFTDSKHYQESFGKLLRALGVTPSASRDWVSPDNIVINAIRILDVKAVQRALAGGSDANEKDRRGYTALMYAARCGDVQCAQLLIDHGANVNSQDIQGLNATAIEWAVEFDNSEMVKLLLLHGANPNQDMRNTCWTILFEAAMMGHTSIVQILLEHGADANTFEWEGHSSALMMAGRGGRMHIAELLVAHGAKVNQADNMGWTPLINAAWHGYLEITRFLINKGAELNAEDNYGGTALGHAAESGHQDIVALLVSSGAEVNVKTKDVDGSYYSKTPLIMAAENGHFEVVKMLIKSGADMEARGGDDRSALECAMENGHETVVQLLREEHGGNSS